MTHQIRLCDADRAAFGVAEEWLDFDPLEISVDDLDTLADTFGFDPADWPEPLYGSLTLEQAGDPDAKPKPPRWQGKAVTWMLLRQHGVDLPLERAGEVRWFKARMRRLEDPGKDEPSGSGSTEPSTTAPSENSST